VLTIVRQRRWKREWNAYSRLGYQSRSWTSVVTHCPADNLSQYLVLGRCTCSRSFEAANETRFSWTHSQSKTFCVPPSSICSVYFESESYGSRRWG
jgi:hypothetical protein